MRILIIDDNDIGNQLHKIAEETGIALSVLTEAWNERNTNTTQQIIPRPIIFDYYEPDKIDHVAPEKPLSYQAQQKQLPKFLKRKKW